MKTHLPLHLIPLHPFPNSIIIPLQQLHSLRTRILNTRLPTNQGRLTLPLILEARIHGNKPPESSQLPRPTETHPRPAVGGDGSIGQEDFGVTSSTDGGGFGHYNSRFCSCRVAFRFYGVGRRIPFDAAIRKTPKGVHFPLSCIACGGRGCTFDRSVVGKRMGSIVDAHAVPPFFFGGVAGEAQVDWHGVL